MKPTALSLLLIASPLMTQAQAPAPATAPAAAPVPAPAIDPATGEPFPAKEGPKLTEAQVKSALSQLADLEKDIQQRRGSNLGAILTRLRAAMNTDAEAIKLYLECESEVNMARKEVDKAEARRRLEQKKADLEKKGTKQDDTKDQGDFGLAVRLQIHYLVLTLEAHEAKDEEFKKMVPKLQAYIAEALAAAPKLKGRAYSYLAGGGGGRGAGNPNVIIDALQLDRYLAVQNWTARPLDFGGMYTKTILPLAEADKKDLLPSLWDARITAEGTFRKEQMFPAEYELWLQNDLPDLRWTRARYLYDKGPSALAAMGDMLKQIKDYPGHPNAPAWVKELRGLVNESSPNAISANSEKPAGS